MRIKEKRGERRKEGEVSVKVKDLQHMRMEHKSPDQLQVEEQL